MAAGSIGEYRYLRPVGLSSSSTTLILPDPDGALSEMVPAKAIELANAEVKQSKESSRGGRPSRRRCYLLLLLSSLPVRHWKAYTKGPRLY